MCIIEMLQSVISNCVHLSLISRPPHFLFFSKSALPLPCIILNANRRTKTRGGLGTRLIAGNFRWCKISQCVQTSSEEVFAVFIFTERMCDTDHTPISWWPRPTCTSYNLSLVLTLVSCSAPGSSSQEQHTGQPHVSHLITTKNTLITTTLGFSNTCIWLYTTAF